MKNLVTAAPGASRQGRPPDKEKNAARVAEYKRQKELGLSTHRATCAAADELEFAQKVEVGVGRSKGDFDDSAGNSPRPSEAPRLPNAPAR